MNKPVAIWVLEALPVRAPLGGDEGHVIGNCREGNPHCKLAKNLAESYSCFRVLWKVELAIDEIKYLAKAISKNKC